MNVYDNCKTMADRKIIDAVLKARAEPRMIYETSIIIPSAIPGCRPMVHKINTKPYRK